MAWVWRDLGGIGLWSLVGFERLGGMGKPTVAEGRGTLAGQRFGGGLVLWATSTGALEVPGGEGAGLTAMGGRGKGICGR